MQSLPGKLDQEQLEEVFPQILENLRTSGIADRSNTARNISLWIQRSAQLGDKEKSASQLTWPILTEIFQFASENLTDSNPALTNILKDLLKNVITIKNKLYPEETYESWVRFVVQFPYTSKAVYHVLEPLGKYIPGPYEWGLSKEFYSSAFPLLITLQHANPVAKCLASLMRFRESDLESAETERNWIDTWTFWVYTSFENEYRENVLLYFLQLMLRQRPSSFKQLYENNPSTRLEDKTGLLKVAHDLDIDINPYIDDSLAELLHSSSRSLRYEVLSLVLLSKQTSKPIPSRVYDLFTHNIDVILGEANPKFRNQVFGVIRQFVFRVRSSAYAQQRDAKEGVPETVTQAIAFFKWFLEYLYQFLKPGTPYRCLVTACQYLELLTVAGLDKRVDSKYFESSPVQYPFTLEIFTKSVIRDLINLIPNDYQDIRLSAAKLISMAPQPVEYLTSAAEIDILANTSEQLLAGVRGRQGDGGARVAQLVYRSYSEEHKVAYLDKLVKETISKVELAENDIKIASQDHGIHGYFQALALICEAIDFKTFTHPDLIVEMINACKRIWVASQNTLTNSAPEGNIPIPLDVEEDDETLSGQHGATGQVVLSYAWRAVSQSTTLLLTLLERFNFSDEDLTSVGLMLVQQLTSIRHRGAFTSVAPALQAACRNCYARENLKALPKSWLYDHLETILVQTKLITRRSAGLPLLVTSILISHEKPLEPFVDEVFSKLLSMAQLPLPDLEKENKLDLPQVHAFNCIKGMMWESQLTKPTAAHLEAALALAISAFDSPIWSIRNCGVMLFSTLHNRLFGSRASTMSASVFFSRFKSIKKILLDHLARSASSSASANLEAVYPVLALLLKLKAVGNYDGLVPFIPTIIDLLGSPFWKVREMSAWTLGNILTEEQTVDIALNLIAEQATTSKQNFLHGILMALNCMTIPANSRETFNALLLSKIPEIYHCNNSMETKIEVLKLLERSELKIPLVWPEDTEHLNPSLGILKSLVAKAQLAKDTKDLVAYLNDKESHVNSVAIEYLTSNPTCVTAEIYDAVVSLLKRSEIVDVKSKTLELIALLAERKQYVSDFEVILPLFESGNSEKVRQNALICLGPLAAKSGEKDRETWLQELLFFGREDASSVSREAAMVSVKRFLESKTEEMTASFNDRLYYFIYESLSDDEEDIQMLAAEVASKVLGADSWAPRYCEPRILDLVSSEYLAFHLCGEEVLGLQVKMSLMTDKTLFVVEKGNLYRDEIAQIKQIANRVKSGDIDGDIYMQASESLAFTRSLNTESPLGYSSNAELAIVLTRLLAIQEKSKDVFV